MYADAIVSMLTVVAFCAFFYGPWQAACTDGARQIIFEKRDRLFDLAMAGALDFESKDYLETRKSLEGMIRFAHRLTWTRLAFLWLYHHSHNAKGSRLQPPLVGCDPAVQKAVRTLISDATLALIGMMALKSMITAPVSFVALSVAVCTRGLVVFRNEAPVIRNLAELVRFETEFAEAA